LGLPIVSDAYLVFSLFTPGLKMIFLSILGVHSSPTLVNNQSLFAGLGVWGVWDTDVRPPIEFSDELVKG
jgi:hypothetical protein